MTGPGKRSTSTQSVASPATTDLSVIALTSNFQMRGTLKVLGVLQTFINDEQKSTFSIFNCEVAGLDVTNPAAQMKHPEMLILKRGIHVLAFEQMPPPSAISLMARSESLALYTNTYVIIGKVHMGPEARLTDFIEATSSQYLSVSAVKIFPLFQPRAGMVQSAPLAMVHKSSVQMYHHA